VLPNHSLAWWDAAFDPEGSILRVWLYGAHWEKSQRAKTPAGVRPSALRDLFCGFLFGAAFAAIWCLACVL